jgi:hypothetical protein
MDKERLEELKEQHEGFVEDGFNLEELACAAPELIAEVEFLTKVAEQAVGCGEIFWSKDAEEFWVGRECVVANERRYPELAQYLKRGKE